MLLLRLHVISCAALRCTWCDHIPHCGPLNLKWNLNTLSTHCLKFCSLHNRVSLVLVNFFYKYKDRRNRPKIYKNISSNPPRGGGGCYKSSYFDIFRSQDPFGDLFWSFDGNFIILVHINFTQLELMLNTIYLIFSILSVSVLLLSKLLVKCWIVPIKHLN